MAFYNEEHLEGLPHETQEKLKAIEFYESYSVFVRNLKLLINNADGIN